jgi:DNA/RNA-binding domain of Phe-tRNA-synthetase-like protein
VEQLIKQENNMPTISTTKEWASVHAGATIGLLEISGVENAHPSPALNEYKREAETHLREKYGDFKRADFLALPVMAAFDQYYKRFNKTYHVQLQLESIVLKGKSLPSVSPAVDSYFMAEVQTLVLTSGHDVAKLQEPITIDVSREGDMMRQASGEPKAIRPGDMVMKHRGDIICCSIIYGQEPDSLISAGTQHVLYVAYAPAGVPTASIEDQFERIESYIRLFSPQAIVTQKRLISADTI